MLNANNRTTHARSRTLAIELDGHGIKRMTASVLILTYNEQANIADCLNSVRWCDDVVVFDSYSTDATVDIAKSLGARVFQRRFDDYGSQREAARVEVDYKHPWVLALDADERPDEELVAEIKTVTSQPGNCNVGYRVRVKDFFMGRWIKHACLYPTWHLRLFKNDVIRYAPRSVHEQVLIDGPVDKLDGHLLHHSFNKGLQSWLEKHVRYAFFEANENIKSLDAGRVDWSGLVARDPVCRRRALKGLSCRLPCRPLLRFLYGYFWRFGFLDGRAGFTYCRMMAIYESMIVLGVRELRRKEQGLSM